MTDKKPTKRNVALPRLHKAVEEFCVDKGLGTDQPIGVLLDAVRDAWFQDAKK